MDLNSRRAILPRNAIGLLYDCCPSNPTRMSVNGKLVNLSRRAARGSNGASLNFGCLTGSDHGWQICRTRSIEVRYFVLGTQRKLVCRKNQGGSNLSAACCLRRSFP